MANIKRLTIICLDKDSSKTFSESIVISNQDFDETTSERKQRIEKEKQEIFEGANDALGRWRYEVECFDHLTEEEEEMLDELELMPD